MWAAIENGIHQHIFVKLDQPYKMVGGLVQWASICGRAFAFEAPQGNPKKRKCEFCLDKVNGNHVI